MANAQNQKTTHKHKDTLFRTLFSNSKNFLELYNAVTNENLPADTEITPYPTNELLAKFNDLAAGVGDQLVVFFEHQSTPSQNMPLRLLSYVADILHLHLVNKDKLYGNELVPMPTPRFYVLYNGEQKLETNELKLSDSFKLKDKDPALELTAKIIDIKLETGAKVLKTSETLKSYSYLIEKIRQNMRDGMARDDAIVKAMKLCIEKDVLKDFLQENYAEVLKMLNWEYDADTHMRVIAEENEQKGMQKGINALADLIKQGIPLEEAVEKAMKLNQIQD